MGFDKITYGEGHVYKKFKESYIDFSSIAKGYAVDIIHNHLKLKNLTDTYVEIGGEVRVSGKNIKNNWVLGIREPSFDGNINLSAKVSLPNMSLATSEIILINIMLMTVFFFILSIQKVVTQPIQHAERFSFLTIA